MAARDADRTRPNTPVSGDVVPERTHPQSEGVGVYPQTESSMKGTERVRDTARQAADSAERTARSALSSQKERAASGLDDIVEVLHATGNQLRDHDRASLANYADQAADRIERFARDLHRRDIGELMADAEDFARDHPEIVLGGALMIGLLTARFLKSTSYRPEREGEMAYGETRVGAEGYAPEERLPYQARGTGI